jgi:glycosyltransferase involved in cell wall biosynthesis
VLRRSFARARHRRSGALARALHVRSSGDAPSPRPAGGKSRRPSRRLRLERGEIDRDFSFVGFRKDVAPYVADFDVAVVPSVYADPLPRAVIESMALGKPVVAFDVGGVSEMLEDGVTGALIRAPDVDAMAAQMLRYLRDPNLRATQGRAGRERVARNFDARAHARIVFNMYFEPQLTVLHEGVGQPAMPWRPEHSGLLKEPPLPYQALPRALAPWMRASIGRG